MSAAENVVACAIRPSVSVPPVAAVPDPPAVLVLLAPLLQPVRASAAATTATATLFQSFIPTAPPCAQVAHDGHACER